MSHILAFRKSSFKVAMLSLSRYQIDLLAIAYVQAYAKGAPRCSLGSFTICRLIRPRGPPQPQSRWRRLPDLESSRLIRFLFSVLRTSFSLHTSHAPPEMPRGPYCTLALASDIQVVTDSRSCCVTKTALGISNTAVPLILSGCACSSPLEYHRAEATTCTQAFRRRRIYFDSW